MPGRLVPMKLATSTPKNRMLQGCAFGRGGGGGGGSPRSAPPPALIGHKAVHGKGSGLEVEDTSSQHTAERGGGGRRGGST